jgi:hypothetical protein
MLAKLKEVLFTTSAVILLAPLTARPSAAQSIVVRGVVTDEAEAAIPSASVEISCRQKGRVTKVESTHTGTSAGFKLEPTLLGTCKVRFSAPGFKSLRRSIPVLVVAQC